MKFIKENLRVVIAVGVAIILIIAGIIMILVNNDIKDNNSNNDHEEQASKIEDVTGMSKEDAIEIVKENFYSDNYKFSVEVTIDSLYKVTAINIVDNSEIVYFVDPANEKVYIDIDTE